MTILTNDIFSTLFPKLPEGRSLKCVKYLNKTMRGYEISTILRVSHFLAQLAHESGGFVYSSEIWGPTESQKNYQYRSELGNTHIPAKEIAQKYGVDPGYLYRGRGFIQLTGYINYEACGRNLGIDLTNNPDRVKDIDMACYVSGWFWDKKNLNFYADRDDLQAITKRVNGGLNGLKEREYWLNKIKSMLVLKEP